MSYPIGFIQGRLSPMVGGRIQAFPWDNWKSEFLIAQELKLKCIEWTLDHNCLYQNPLMTLGGQNEIRKISKYHAINIPSLTGDCFMEAPFWKAQGEELVNLEQDFIEIARACNSVGIKTIVVPLVDNGRLTNTAQMDKVVNFMTGHTKFFVDLSLAVAFEVDLLPDEMADFMARLPQNCFGVNYDIGNSAALGYDPDKEFAAYGKRIVNVHVKDRLRGGTTVPLGTGNADFKKVFRLLKKCNYKGNLIMQTARALDDNHAVTLASYRNQIETWVNDA